MVGSTLLSAVGCGGSNDGMHEAQAAPPSMQEVCTSPGIRYLGKPVPGGEREDHWHGDYGAARARKLGAGGRIDLELVFPVDPRYRPLTLLIRGTVHGQNASGVISDKRSCYPRFSWTAHRLSSAK
jgi:hypothetical protein